MTRTIYVDYNATTPVDPAVLQAMLPYLSEHWGNPHSTHAYGTVAAVAMATAREQVASLIGARAGEVVFTSCASESTNLAIKGAAFAYRSAHHSGDGDGTSGGGPGTSGGGPGTSDGGPGTSGGGPATSGGGPGTSGGGPGTSGAYTDHSGGHPSGHLITSAVEHPATINTCRYLAREFGFALTILPVDGDGQVDPADVRRAIRPDTVLISLIHAQNETGVIQPVAEVGRIAREAGVLFHVDGAQSCGKIPVDVEAIGCDLLTVAGHKLYAPKGVGALYVRDGVKLHPLMHGADYEGGRRAGTENVPYAVALGRACEVAEAKLAAGESRRLAELRDRLQEQLVDGLSGRGGGRGAGRGVRVTGLDAPRLPNTLHLVVEGIVGNDLLTEAPQVAASTGSACHAGVSEPSEVLLAMGFTPAQAVGALRLSLGRYSTADEVDAVAAALVEAAGRL